MKLKIDKDIIDTTGACIFAKKCLESFASTLCCGIEEKCSAFLIVQPASSFKSANCSYCQTINNEGADVYICTCPIRHELYNQYGE